jgi:hypothetical protein
MFGDQVFSLAQEASHLRVMRDDQKIFAIFLVRKTREGQASKRVPWTEQHTRDQVRIYCYDEKNLEDFLVKESLSSLNHFVYFIHEKTFK